MLDSMNVTMSISTGLYPNLDLQNTNKLQYITLLPSNLHTGSSTNRDWAHKTYNSRSLSHDIDEL